jgi:putative transposase
VIGELRGTRKHYSIDHLCAAFGYTRQAWYNQIKRSELRVFQEHIVLERIREIRTQLPKTGCIKLHKALNNGFLQTLGLTMGRDAVFDLMRAQGMLVKVKRRYVRTTNSFHRFKIHPDLVQRQAANQAEQIWVSDITYIRVGLRFGFLSLVTDAYSRKIMGYCLCENLKVRGCIQALNKAIKARIYPKRGLIHHSDRGTQYCCDEYIQCLNKHGLLISMTQTGSPYDNAIAERMNGILKMEFDLGKTFNSFSQATACVDQAVANYNSLRLHASCGYRTPEQTHLNEKCQ